MALMVACISYKFRNSLFNNAAHKQIKVIRFAFRRRNTYCSAILFLMSVIFNLAPRRVLVIDKWARLRLAQTSTRRYKIIRLNGKRERSGVAR